MKRFLLVWLCVNAYCAFSTVYAQNAVNLVNNGNFDIHNSPLVGGPHNISTPYFYGDDLTAWKSTNTYDPQYYSTDFPAGDIHNPFSASYGNFTPYNYSPSVSNGAVSLITYGHSCCPYIYAENYIIGTLSSPLVDADYYASMQVRSATASSIQRFAGVGIDITTNDVTDYSRPYSSNADYRLYTASGCGIQSPGVITNTSDWQAVRGKFRGIPNAQYVNVGNFQPYTFTGSTNDFTLASVYVDQIEVFKVPTAGGSITSYACGTNPVTLGEGNNITGSTYAWTIGSGAPFATSMRVAVSPTTTTTYTLTVTLPDGSTSISSATVTVVNYGITITGTYRKTTSNTSQNLANQSSTSVSTGQYIISLKALTKQSYSPVQATFAPWTFGDSGGQGAYNQNNNTEGVVTLQQLYAGVSITATATNTCGETATFSCRLFAQNSSNFAASPNPASTEVVISMLPDNQLASKSVFVPATSISSSASTDHLLKAYLYNSQGALVKTLIAPAGAGKLDVQDLPAGFYILKTGTDKDAPSRHIQIVH